MAAGTVQGCREVALKYHDAAISELRLLPQVRRSTSNIYGRSVSWHLYMVECRHPAAGGLGDYSQFDVLNSSAFFCNHVQHHAAMATAGERLEALEM